MPTLTVNGTELFYSESGKGPETVVLAHGLFTDSSMFATLVSALEANYRVIVYDHRGQGQSPNPGRGFDMDTFSEDAIALMEALGATPCHFIGISMGGNVGMRIAARRPDLLLSLTLSNTRAVNEKPLRRLQHNLLARMAIVGNPAPFVGITLRELFGASTRNDPSKRPLVNEWADKVRLRPKTAVDSFLAVMNRGDFTGEVGKIKCPVLVITGDEDLYCPPTECKALAAAIDGAKLIVIPQCGHSSVLEQPQAVVKAVSELLASRTFRPDLTLSTAAA